MSIVVSDKTREALQNGTPIVALETAVLTAGLPRCQWNPTLGDCPSFIDKTSPIHISLANAMTEVVIQNGSLPVWVGMLQGDFIIGLNSEEILALATDTDATKVSFATFAHAMQQKQSAGTTVAATLLACKLASPTKPIQVFATGGIGGVHKGWAKRLDVSADVTALGTTQTCVVASGAKSILDLNATVEALETVGVPILGLGCNRFPAFIEQSNEDDPHIASVPTLEELADACVTHWNTLSLPSAVLAAIPAPAEVALPRGSLAEAISKAEHVWINKKLPSTTRTPFLLQALAEVTCGKSLRANLELLRNNASIASQLAVTLAR